MHNLKEEAEARQQALIEKREDSTEEKEESWRTIEDFTPKDLKIWGENESEILENRLFLTSNVDELQSSHVEMRKLELEIANLSEELKQKSSHNLNLEKIIKELNEEKTNLTISLEKSALERSQELIEIQSKSIKYLEDYRKIKEENDLLKEDIQVLKETTSNVQSELEICQAEVAKSNETIKTLQKNNEVSKKKEIEKDSEVATLKQKNKNFGDELNRLRQFEQQSKFKDERRLTIIENLLKQLQECGNGRLVSQSQLESHEIKLTKSKATIESSRKEVEPLRSNKNCTQAEVASLKHINENLETELKHLRTFEKEAKMEKEAIVSDNQHLQRKLEDSRSELASANAIVDTLREEITILKAEQSPKPKDETSKVKNLEPETERESEMESKIESLKEEKESLEEDIDLSNSNENYIEEKAAVSESKCQKTNTRLEKAYKVEKEKAKLVSSIQTLQKHLPECEKPEISHEENSSKIEKLELQSQFLKNQIQQKLPQRESCFVANVLCSTPISPLSSEDRKNSDDLKTEVHEREIQETKSKNIKTNVGSECKEGKYKVKDLVSKFGAQTHRVAVDNVQPQKTTQSDASEDIDLETQENGKNLHQLKSSLNKGAFDGTSPTNELLTAAPSCSAKNEGGNRLNLEEDFIDGRENVKNLTSRFEKDKDRETKVETMLVRKTLPQERLECFRSEDNKLKQKPVRTMSDQIKVREREANCSNMANLKETAKLEDGKIDLVFEVSTICGGVQSVKVEEDFEHEHIRVNDLKSRFEVKKQPFEARTSAIEPKFECSEKQTYKLESGSLDSDQKIFEEKTEDLSQQDSSSSSSLVASTPNSTNENIAFRRNRLSSERQPLLRLLNAQSQKSVSPIEKSGKPYV